MPPNVHVHLHVADLARSVAFYEAFLGAPPVKRKPGYAKFLAHFAPLNLALSEVTAKPAGEPTLSHLGLQLGSSAEVLAHLERAKAAGLAVREEIDVTCCFAKQDKFWVHDPDGVEWEVYFLKQDVEEEGAPDRSAPTTACCTNVASASNVAIPPIVPIVPIVPLRQR